jgi:hypothetical protein
MCLQYYLVNVTIVFVNIGGGTIRLKKIAMDKTYVSCYVFFMWFLICNTIFVIIMNFEKTMDIKRLVVLGWNSFEKHIKKYI